MNCEKVRQWLGEYWDMPENDLRRKSADDHIATCSRCAAEFEIWRESHELIHEAQSAASPYAMPKPSTASIADRVMSRIYADESWRRPVAEKMYSLSYKIRRNLTLVLSFCMAMFTMSLVHLLFRGSSASEPQARVEDFSGLLPVANAVVDSGRSSSVIDSLEGVPVASISDPLILRVGYVPSSPDYFLVLSILGILITVLIMNWFSRIKA